MPRPFNQRPVIKAYIEVRETDAQRHRRSIAEARAANAAIGAGFCPNCNGRPLIDVGGNTPGVAPCCDVCGFALHIAAPVVIDTRATFNRRPTRKAYASRSADR